MIVILFWAKKSIKSQGVHGLSIILLAAFDTFVGVYLAFIASVDVHYRDEFAGIKESWKTSLLCEMMGSFLFMSIVASSYTLFALSAVRYNSICFPFKPQLVKKSSFVVGIIAILILWFGIAFVLFQFMKVNNYVCLLLDFSTNTSHLSVENLAATYILLFLLLMNVIVLFAVFVLNYLTTRLVRRSREDAGRSESNQDKALALRTVLVSVSNFASWGVVVPFGIMSLAGYKISSGITAWIAVLGLPLNSLLNPILYTFSTIAFISKIKTLIGKICATNNVPE